MKTIEFVAGIAALALVAPAAAQAGAVFYSFDTPGAWSGELKLNVDGAGNAKSGSGRIDIPGYNSQHLTLIAPSTPGAESPFGYRSNGGTDIFGVDTSVPPDTNGLLFSVGKGAPAPGSHPLWVAYSDGGAGFQSGLFGHIGNGPAIYTYDLATTLTAGRKGSFGAVPEPATWASMILGVGMIGAAVRRRKAAAATAA
jgi:hypothetical protein